MLSKCHNAAVRLGTVGAICTQCNQNCALMTRGDIIEQNTQTAHIKAVADRIEGGRNLREKATVWMEKNPKAVELFERFALEYANTGRKFGINLLRERVRWETNVTTQGSAFKISNDISPYIARHLISKHPHLEQFIELRKTNW